MIQFLKEKLFPHLGLGGGKVHAAKKDGKAQDGAKDTKMICNQN